VGRVERPTADVVLLGDNLDVLPRFADGSFQLVYADPPFNTGATVRRRTLEVVRDEQGDRVGFQGRRYSAKVVGESSFGDSFVDYLGFLEPRLREIHRLLAATGTLYLHLDYREAHHAKVLLDELFGHECFLNEIVWAYDYGAKSRRRWPAKHDTILVYVKDPEAYHFDSAEVDREPYMAPGLVTAEKAARSSLPPAPRRPATRPRSPRGSSGGSSRRPAVRATGASTRSPGAAPSARWRRSSAAATFWSTRAPRRSP
jgi:DNA modification methylase